LKVTIAVGIWNLWDHPRIARGSAVEGDGSGASGGASGRRDEAIGKIGPSGTKLLHRRRHNQILLHNNGIQHEQTVKCIADHRLRKAHFLAHCPDKLKNRCQPHPPRILGCERRHCGICQSALKRIVLGNKAQKDICIQAVDHLVHLLVGPRDIVPGQDAPQVLD
jgi:hypothetical protein